MPLPAKSIKANQEGGGGGSVKDFDDSDAPSNNLWVGNLSFDVTDSDLMSLFAQYGALDSVTSYSSRSYGFVFFKRIEDAKAAKNALQGTPLRGTPIKIEFARPVRSDLCALLLLLLGFLPSFCLMLCAGSRIVVIINSLTFKCCSSSSSSKMIPRRKRFFNLNGDLLFCFSNSFKKKKINEAETIRVDVIQNPHSRYVRPGRN